MQNLGILSHEELLAIEGGVNWGQVAEGFGTLALATGFHSSLNIPITSTSIISSSSYYRPWTSSSWLYSSCCRFFF
ncbi:bacteriocin class II family protein [Lysinibacillus sp. NPDC059133]|uniref:bacteriocin class II family protein n=1 Tax=Lysinibacillus sp. NPDC059133 TaxID=3346737 RepID=UPI00369A8F15